MHSETMNLGSWMRLPVRSMLAGSRTNGSVFTEMSKALKLSLFWILIANCCWRRGPVNEAGAVGQDVEDMSAMQTVPVLCTWPTGKAGRKAAADSAASMIERRGRYLLKRVSLLREMLGPP